MTIATKAYKGIGMEGGVARWYDRTTRRGMNDFKSLAGKIAATGASNALEIAPGPGFLSIEMARLGLCVRAVDISRTFIEIAQRNAAAEGVSVRFEQGNASALPLADASVNFVVCRAAFKNFSEPVKALAEMRRVLEPGGTALLIDLRRDTSVAEISKYVNQMGGSWLNRKFMLFTFRAMLLKRAYTLDQMESMMAEAGWRDPRLEVSSIGFEAWMTK